jgi:predicted acetyltransferase
MSEVMVMEYRTRDESRHHTRELAVDGQVVSWLTVIDYRMRIGTAEVRMAGIAGVESRPEHRMKGHMRGLFADTVAYMTGQGYVVSALFGIPNFYHRFGYATCLANTRAVLQTRDAELAQSDVPPHQLRPATADDMPWIVDLYNRHNAARSGTLVRLNEHFKGFTKGTHWGQPAECMVLEDHAGQRAGYAAWDRSRERVSVVEAECVDDRWHGALLHEFAGQAIAKRCGQVALHLPQDHPFAEYAQRFGCEWSIEYPRQAEGMMRILDQAALFDKLQPELQRRYSRVAPLSEPRAAILATDLASTRIDIAGGQVSCRTVPPSPVVPPPSRAAALPTIRLTQDRLMQLVMGYRSARDLLSERAYVYASGDALPLLEALFPKSPAYLWLADQF